VPRGRPLAIGSETNKAVPMPGAANASALSNTQALAGRRDPLARCFMTRRYRHPAAATSTHG
jgi:hypothetical protein